MSSRLFQTVTVASVIGAGQYAYGSWLFTEHTDRWERNLGALQCRLNDLQHRINTTDARGIRHVLQQHLRDVYVDMEQQYEYGKHSTLYRILNPPPDLKTGPQRWD